MKGLAFYAGALAADARHALKGDRRVHELAERIADTAERFAAGAAEADRSRDSEQGEFYVLIDGERVGVPIGQSFHRGGVVK